MKAIMDLTTEEKRKLEMLKDNLSKKLKGITRNDYFDSYSKISGYAHYRFEGEFSDKLVELLGRVPTTDEIIILVDGGFSHFGASCGIKGKKFSGKVNID